MGIVLFIYYELHILALSCLNTNAAAPAVYTAAVAVGGFLKQVLANHPIFKAAVTPVTANVSRVDHVATYFTTILAALVVAIWFAAERSTACCQDSDTFVGCDAVPSREVPCAPFGGELQYTQCRGGGRRSPFHLDI